GQAEARPAVLLREVQAEPADVAHLGPEAGQLFGLRLEQGAGGPARAVLAEEVGGRLGQGPVIIGDGDRHDLTVPNAARVAYPVDASGRRAAVDPLSRGGGAGA